MSTKVFVIHSKETIAGIRSGLFPFPALARIGLHKRGQESLAVFRRWVDLVIARGNALFRFDVVTHIVFSEGRFLLGGGLRALRALCNQGVFTSVKTLIPLIFLLAGCALPKGQIVSVTQSVIGIKVGQNPHGTPELQIGFFRSTFQIVPTSTNQIYAPMVNSSLSLDQKSFTTAIDEDFQTGGAVAPSDSVAKRGAMSRGKAPRIEVPMKKQSGWNYLDWSTNMPSINP